MKSFSLNKVQVHLQCESPFTWDLHSVHSEAKKRALCNHAPFCVVRSYRPSPAPTPLSSWSQEENIIHTQQLRDSREQSPSRSDFKTKLLMNALLSQITQSNFPKKSKHISYDFISNTPLKKKKKTTPWRLLMSMQCDKDVLWEQSHIGKSSPTQMLRSIKKVLNSARPQSGAQETRAGPQGTSSGIVF